MKNNEGIWRLEYVESLIHEDPDEKILICSKIQDETYSEICQKASLNDVDFI